MVSRFEAQYTGTCTARGDRIELGDVIEEDEDGGYSHADCAPTLLVVTAKPPCPKCWLVHAGECM